MKKTILLAFAALLSLTCAAKMRYTVELDTVGRYLNVRLLYTASEPGQQRVELQMPVWAPGYYDIINYPKYLTDFSATRTDGTPLPWQKFRRSTWIVDMGGADSIIVTYRTYANKMDVADNLVRPEGAFIAPNGTFMYENGL